MPLVSLLALLVSFSAQAQTPVQVSGVASPIPAAVHQPGCLGRQMVVRNGRFPRLIEGDAHYIGYENLDSSLSGARFKAVHLLTGQLAELMPTYFAGIVRDYTADAEGTIHMVRYANWTENIFYSSRANPSISIPLLNSTIRYFTTSRVSSYFANDGSLLMGFYEGYPAGFRPISFHSCFTRTGSQHRGALCANGATQSFTLPAPYDNFIPNSRPLFFLDTSGIPQFYVSMRGNGVSGLYQVSATGVTVLKENDISKGEIFLEDFYPGFFLFYRQGFEILAALPFAAHLEFPISRFTPGSGVNSEWSPRASSRPTGSLGQFHSFPVLFYRMYDPIQQPNGEPIVPPPTYHLTYPAPPGMWSQASSQQIRLYTHGLFLSNTFLLRGRELFTRWRDTTPGTGGHHIVRLSCYW